MNKLTSIVLALGLVTAGACKKDDKKDEAAAAAKEPAKDPAKTPPSEPPKDPAATGSTTTPPTEAPAGDALTLTWKGPAVGLKAEEQKDMLTKISITPPGAGAKPVDMTVKEEEKEHIEIVEATPEFATKVKVHYEVSKKTQAMGGKEKAEEGPLHGKAYVVWAEGGAIKATNDKGEAVSAAEQTELEDSWRGELGRIPGMAKVVVGKSWKKGEKVNLTPEEIKEATATLDESMKASSIAVTLLGVEGGIASFEFDMALEREEKGGKLTMPSKAVIKIDVANVRPVEVVMTGNIEGSINGAGAKGSMEGKETTSYK